MSSWRTWGNQVQHNSTSSVVDIALALLDYKIAIEKCIHMYMYMHDLGSLS